MISFFFGILKDENVDGVLFKILSLILSALKMTEK